MRRGVTVLKMRRSSHDTDIREYTIDASGMHIGSPFRSIFGILSGNFQHVAQAEPEHLQSMLMDETPKAIGEGHQVNQG
jgi:circadian clock protein KaiC